MDYSHIKENNLFFSRASNNPLKFDAIPLCTLLLGASGSISNFIGIGI